MGKKDRRGKPNPCIEIWFAAYFGKMPNIDTSVKCCEYFSRIYESKIGNKYEKSTPDIYDKLFKYGDEAKAFEIAELKRKECFQNGKCTPSAMYPCTTVDFLIREITDKR